MLPRSQPEEEVSLAQFGSPAKEERREVTYK
jgi:hypothetical protein